MVSGPCPYCGCAEIDEDPSRGDAVCTECGAVLDENCIVSEVQFIEDSRGQSRAVGALTNPDGTLHCSLDGRRVGGKSSREITLKNAERKIFSLCSQLRLPSHCATTAHGLYKMALHSKLTKGRRNSHVIAACVYITCRQEKTSHMLLDLSDILQVNVYELGRTYSYLSNALNIKPTVIDPSIYCMRFANQLQLGEKTHAVFMTASRIVQRMKKDWMQAGRRPAGLCGAALLVAARRHNFNRTVKDIIKVVKVCSATVRKRLTEFSETPSSRLTLDEFMNIDLEEEQDPPAFRNIRKRKLKELEEPNEEVKKQVVKLREEIEKALEETRKKHMLSGKYALFTPTSGDSCDGSFPEEFVLEETLKTINEDLIASAGGECVSEDQLNDIIIPDSCRKYLSGAFTDPEKTSYPDQSLAAVGIRVNPGEPVNSKEKEKTDTAVILDLTGLDDKELDSYIMTDNEAKGKIELWIRTNISYLRERTEKEEKLAREEEENANKTEHKRKKKKLKRTPIQASTAGEAIEQMVQQKKISNKLDYDVLKRLGSGLSDSDARDKESHKEEEALKRAVRSKPVKNTCSPVVPQHLKERLSAFIPSSNKWKDSSLPLDDVQDITEVPQTSASTNIVASSAASTVTIDVDPEIVHVEDVAQNDNEEFEEEDDGEHDGKNDLMSAAKLLGYGGGDDDDYYDYQDDYDDC